MSDPEAERVVNLAFSPKNASACKNPVVFGVTNFDPAVEEGRPNFVDIPRNGGYKKWGIFDTLAMRMTTVTTKYTHVQAEL